MELSNGEVPNFDNAIWWYSCNEAPIFDQMNNILRLENFELLMCHRYYISDLCQMIERSYAQNKLSQKRIVYRADKLSRPDFNILEQSKEQKDATITINGFISTSKNEGISLEYAAAKLKKQGDDVVIMYEITIDPAIACSSYADIECISFHPREEEVLFNMGSTFQIDGIEDDPTNAKIKRIKLTARDFNLTLLDEMKAKVKQSSQATLSILLVRYLIELGEDRVSKRYLNQIIDSEQLENDPNLVAVYNCLGTIYSRQALHGEALDYYRKALNTQARLQFSNNNALAEIFNNIGQTHLGLNQLEEAEQNLEEGVRIQKREPKHVQQHLASLYCNKGQVAYARHDYDEAEENFQLSYDLYNRNTKISHDALEKRLLKADLCIAFGHLKSVQNPKDPAEAKEKFTEALNIYESTLPSSHPKVAEARIEIVCEYARNKNFQSVITYYDERFIELLKDYEIKQTTSQQDLANLYAIIGACFAHEKKFDEAMTIWKKGNEHEQKVFLDQLLSSARISKIQLPIRLVESAYRIALDHYANIQDAPGEYLGILYAKMYMYDKVIDCLRGQSSFLLANTCILQRKFKGTMTIYKRILELKNYDLTLMIGILLRLLAAKKTATVDEESVTELVRIEKLLTSRIADNEAIRLRMIINDYLAETYLSVKTYDVALYRSQISFELKQRHYSSYHPSLVRNYQLTASCSFQRGDYKNAMRHYEKAVEIQLDSMPSGHADISSNYFLMGDCYCQWEKIELANEFYDRAQASNDIDSDDDGETKRDVKALIRMHSNLTDVFAKQKDFTSARAHQQEKIDLLKEVLPAFVVKVIEDEDAFGDLQTTLTTRLGLANGKTFAQVLRNLVFIRLSLARALLQADERTDDDEDSTDLYEQVVQLELKLTMFEKAGEKRLPTLYEDIGNAYSKLYSSMKESTRENLLKALDEVTNIEQQRSLEFRVGNLYFDEKNFSEADRFWKQALKKVPDIQMTAKAIIEKLIEKNKDNLSNSEDDDDDDDESDEDAEEENHSEQLSEHGKSHSRAQSQRRQSTKSINNKEKPEELAQAYLDLKDDETALKYLTKYITKLEDTLKPTWNDITIQDEQLQTVKFFHSLLTQTISSTMPSSLELKEIPNKDVWINLLQTYMKMFTIAVRVGSSSNEIAKATFATFQIYQKLYEVPTDLTTIFDILFNGDLENLQWSDLIDLLPLNESIDILMRIASYYISNEAWHDAIEIYSTLQNNPQIQETLKSAVNYGILKLFELHLTADEEYRANIMAINIHSQKIPVFDRILLCRLIISFMEEMEDETAITTFKKELLNLQKETWAIVDVETIDCIGHVLTKVEDNTLACLYWSELQNIYNEMLPSSIVTRLYSTDVTFEQIFRATQEMNNELSDNILALAESYETMAIYEENDKSNEDACESLEKAMIIWNKIPSTTKKVAQLREKVNSLQNE
jgi:Tfp pilus assembly protein PilF